MTTSWYKRKKLVIARALPRVSTEDSTSLSHWASCYHCHISTLPGQLSTSSMTPPSPCHPPPDHHHHNRVWHHHRHDGILNLIVNTTNSRDNIMLSQTASSLSVVHHPHTIYTHFTERIHTLHIQTGKKCISLSFCDYDESCIPCSCE
jgi:hypothetical protein